MAYIRIATANYSGAYAGQQLYCEYQVLSQSGNTYNLRFQLVGYYPSGNNSYNSSSSWSFKVGGNSYSGTCTFGNNGTYTIFKTVDLSYTGGQSISVSGSHNSGVSLGNASVSGSISLASVTTETYSSVTKLPTNNGANDNADWVYEFTKPSSGLTCRLVMCDTTTDGAGNFFIKENVTSPQTVNLGGAESLWKKHPNEKTIVVSLRHCTMAGSTLKKIFYCDFRVNLTNATPALGAYTVTDVNSATVSKSGSANNCIIGHSKIKVNITGAPTLKKGAKFSKYEITCGTITKTLTSSTGAVEFENAPSNSVTIKVIDSRGLSASATKSLTKYTSYTPVSITNFKAERQSTNTTVKLSWTKTGTPTSYSYEYKRRSVTSWSKGGASISNTATSINVTGFDASIAYDFRLTATDGIETVSATTVVAVYGVPLIVTNANKLVLNQKYTQVVNNAGNRTDILNYVYPVGSIYISNKSSFNPNTEWGGTWTKIEGRFLIGANSTYSLGSTGGKTSIELRALIGAVNGLADSLGYKTASAISGQSYTYGIRGTGISSISSVNHTTPVIDTSQKTTATNIIPPYKAVYIWERTA